MFVGFPVAQLETTTVAPPAPPARRAIPNAVDAIRISFSFVVMSVDGLPATADGQPLFITWSRDGVSKGTTEPRLCSKGSAVWTNSITDLESSKAIIQFTCILEKAASSEAAFSQGKTVTLSVCTKSPTGGDKAIKFGTTVGTFPSTLQ